MHIHCNIVCDSAVVAQMAQMHIHCNIVCDSAVVAQWHSCTSDSVNKMADTCVEQYS